MKRLVPFLLLAACGGKPAPATTPPVDNGGGAAPPGPPYAALFEKGRSWTYQLDVDNSYWDDQDPAADADGNVHSKSSVEASCKVVGVEDVDGGKLSHIECTGFEDTGLGNEPLSGDWFADATGVYRGGYSDGEGRSLVLAAKPVARQETSKDNPDDPTQETGFLTIEQKGDDWCWTSSFAWGDESWESLCFGEDGITEGTFGWAGGSVHEATFTLKDTK